MAYALYVCESLVLASAACFSRWRVDSNDKITSDTYESALFPRDTIAEGLENESEKNCMSLYCTPSNWNSKFPSLYLRFSCIFFLQLMSLSDKQLEEEGLTKGARRKLLSEIEKNRYVLGAKISKAQPSSPVSNRDQTFCAF